jgi:hypothetical protein
MGSYGVDRTDDGLTTAQFFAKEMGPTYTFLATAVVKTGDSARYGGWPEVFYAAVKLDDPGHLDHGIVFAFVAPFLRKGSGGMFYYKPMEEDMGPCEASAPARILDLLTPAKDEYAKAWRASCRANLAKLESVKSLKEGSHIHTATPLDFGSFKTNNFKVYDPKKGTYKALEAEGLPFAGTYLGLVRIPVTTLTSMDFEVVHVLDDSKSYLVSLANKSEELASETVMDSGLFNHNPLDPYPAGE